LVIIIIIIIIHGLLHWQKCPQFHEEEIWQTLCKRGSYWQRLSDEATTAKAKLDQSQEQWTKNANDWKRHLVNVSEVRGTGCCFMYCSCLDVNSMSMYQPKLQI